MNATKLRPFTTELELLAREGFNRDGKLVLIDPTFVATREAKTGVIRYHLTVPNAERLVFPDDLGVILQCFGWGIVNWARPRALSS